MKDFVTDLQSAFDAHMSAYKADPNPDYKTRKDRLTRLEAALERFAPQLIEAMQADFSHRSFAEASNLDITIPLGDIRMNRRKLRAWMRPRRYGMPKHLLPARGRVVPMPKGVVGVIAPWNFPVYLSIAPIAAALAAGNRVMLKPSELSPRTSDVMAQMIAEVFDPTEISVHLGDGALAAAFSELPFGHLLFTGSTQVGRLVAQAAAKNLTPVTLELGGKSPAVLGQKADLKYAAKRIAFGKTSNAGQVCVSPDYALVPRGQEDAFAAQIMETWREFFPEGPQSTDYTAIITDRHRSRVQRLISEAEAGGAKIMRFGDTEGLESRKEAPTLILNPPLDAEVMQEEIFGPILPIISYDSLEEAQKFVAERPSPLALYIFTDDAQERDAWVQKSLAGGMCVNETSFHVAADTMPFGGVGESGMGAYHGQAGFDTFSHLKSVLYQPKLNGAFLFDPPADNMKTRMSKMLRRII